MKIQGTVFALLLLAASSYALADEAMSQHPVADACAADAQTAGCPGAKGRELGQCLRNYKKAHKSEFKVSDGCKAAIKSAREAFKAKRAG